MLLSGDRNLTNGIPPNKGILELPEPSHAGWTEMLHNERGNLGQADGSVIIRKKGLIKPRAKGGPSPDTTYYY